MAYWADDRRLDVQQRVLDARQAEAVKRVKEAAAIAKAEGKDTPSHG